MAIFSTLFVDVMSHIIRSNAGKKINTIPELFIKQKIVFNFVYFSSPQTLHNVSLGLEIPLIWTILPYKKKRNLGGL